jgi:osmotically-inducible protein OsmY
MRRLAAFALSCAVAACAPVPVSSGSVFQDERIEKEAIARINARHLGSVRVNVASQGGRLLLTGEVPNAEARGEIEKLVSGVPNLKGVSNELTVGDIIGISTRTSDSMLASDVKFRILKEATFPAGQVKIVTENGTVFLMGSVHRKDGAAAGELAAGVNGVKRVVLVFEYLD